MKNRKLDQQVILYENGGSAQTSGKMRAVGAVVCVLAADVAANGTVPAALDGVFEYTRLTGGSTAWTQGNKIYYDTTNDRLTKVSTGNTYAGIAAKAAADGDAKGEVVLNFGRP